MPIIFFNDTATTEIYTLSLHDALPIWSTRRTGRRPAPRPRPPSSPDSTRPRVIDRKSTRLNSSHANISYAVFCLKKKNKVLYCIQLPTSTGLLLTDSISAYDPTSLVAH